MRPIHQPAASGCGRALVLLGWLLASLPAGAPAADLSDHRRTAKDDGHVLTRPAYDRQGGETVADAVPIVSLPFFDSGATCDNVNDYDAVCPYLGSQSPDVVYSFHTQQETALEIDLCGSQYDTKVYVMDEDLQIVACNDDYYFDGSCGWYVSYLGYVVLEGGRTWYIVVDGYGSDCGQYELAVTEMLIEEVPCPPFGLPEDEPPLADGYVDAWNGGCNSDPPVFQPLMSEPDGCATLCGVSGWYQNGGDFRDTDWFEAVGSGGDVAIDLVADYPVNLFVILPDCEDLQVVAETSALGFEPVQLVWPSPAGQLLWIWVGPQEYTGPVPEFGYVLGVCGLEIPVAAERVSLDGLKSRYR